MSWDIFIYICIVVLIIALVIDITKPFIYFPSLEGFLVNAGDNPFLAGYFPRRGDISFNTEEDGYIQDKRNVRGYVDVQGLGVNHDFCRMIVPKGKKEDQKFFACALAGTENLSSISYKTQSVKNGFKTSRDDYMRDSTGDTKADYCAVIKTSKSSWESRCYRALNTEFDTVMIFDANPPKDILEILEFYQGIMFWFRFIDDMKDYAENLTVFISGNIHMEEADVKPLPSQILHGDDNRTTTLDERVQITEGLKFNGIDQFVRLGDSPEMGFGRKISLTTMRAMSMWVYCDEFRNNMHFLDFGSGPGMDNVFIGILGRGDGTMEKGSTVRKEACKNVELNNVVPDFPSGAQFVPTMRPIELMLSTSANVNEMPYQAPILPRNLKPISPLQADPQTAGGETATLLYEIWNGKLRMQHIKVQGAIKLKEWTHICITTASGDGVRPALQIWINGILKAEDPNGHLPQSSLTSNNYLGKSNWIDTSSQYENKAELFKGRIFDVRGYNQLIHEDKLKKIVRWGKLRLGVK
jgi:hypothetical protein